MCCTIIGIDARRAVSDRIGQDWTADMPIRIDIMNFACSCAKQFDDSCKQRKPKQRDSTWVINKV